ncbi:MAG: ABC transporter substrate-binding protein [Phormidesmis sp. CAN_BIN44]|nr:ABC transporter substrate-binding protein [Phormidesmis sp. CAN_BIN44]
MAKRNETIALVLALLITGVLLFVGLHWALGQFSPQGRGSQSAPTEIVDRISVGNKGLIIANESQAKKAGVSAFAAKDFNQAIAKFKEALQGNRNDPEALIYLNNAQLMQDTRSTMKIVVSVPIGSNLNVAQEILRGVAQAQDEVNRRKNEKPLEVVIANDDNDPEIAKQLAAEFIKDSSTLAVVGHNASDASIAAAPLYQKGQLLMITPTSSADTLSNSGIYVYRVVPSTRYTADVLSRHIIKRLNLKSIAICLDRKSPDSQSFANNFISALSSEGGQFINIGCDFSAPDFNPGTVISKAVSSGAEGLLLSPQVDRINSAINVARTNQGKLQLLGNQTLYTINTLKLGQSDMNGLVLPVVWHPSAIANNPFADDAAKYWGGRVNWRTAMAYDAVQAILTGLKQNESRDGLAKAFSNPNFVAKGASGSIRFLPSGDRNGSAVLVHVQPSSQSGIGYDFVPVSP